MIDHPPPTLHLPEALEREIRRQMESVYPNEGCGILFGRDEGGGGGVRRVERVQQVTNSFETGEQFHRFAITPKHLLVAEREAGTRGELVLGFYHSHPDHPARPSTFDLEHAWPFYSYVILAVEKRKSTLLTSWVLNETTHAFDEQTVSVPVR
jgi:proteasome lid subunit RPN8/RPN11